jgi:hypothetical protein
MTQAKSSQPLEPGREAILTQQRLTSKLPKTLSMFKHLLGTAECLGLSTI